MRPIHTLIIHCSATRADKDFTEQQLEAAHKARGFNECGYHYYIRYNGLIVPMRDIAKVGAHCLGHNEDSIGICYEGGLDSKGKPADTRSFQQKCAIRSLIDSLLDDFPGCHIYGHRELSPDLNGNGIIEPNEYVKLCPVYSVAGEFYPPHLGR
ncbi:MAG: N-acetylmuramoyl-L-alanine amidase [Bacteroidales bacterium]|nr:N-acetylmuramoyl-L-alanine amidase [Bacteroidales bacterium]